jgi:hypothetical protein
MGGYVADGKRYLIIDRDTKWLFNPVTSVNKLTEFLIQFVKFEVVVIVGCSLSNLTPYPGSPGGSQEWSEHRNLKQYSLECTTMFS